MADFSPAVTATVKMNVDATTGGYIAQSGDTVTAQKAVNIQGIKAAATLAEATTVFNAFYGDIAGGTFDSLSAKKTITQGVTE